MDFKRSFPFGAVLLMLGCTPTRVEEPERVEPPSTGKRAETKAEAPEPDEPDPARWACDRDADCTQTCGLGAVNGEWLRANPNADDCDDGCNWNHDDVRCQAGSCVTVNADGSINEGCTRRSKPLYEH